MKEWDGFARSTYFSTLFVFYIQVLVEQVDEQWYWHSQYLCM
jgi:hypothetical protein